MPNRPLKKYSAEEWEYLCCRFKNSILIDMDMSQLGKTAGLSWPFKGSGETPSKYIEFSLEELDSVPGLIGKKSRVRRLMDILRETLAFDEPFGDMADKVESDIEVDATFDHILNRLNISCDYPAVFCHFCDETVELLAPKNPKTLIDIVHFGQTLDQSSEVGADLRAFINTLVHNDGYGIRKHIPYRRGERGLHLAEAVGLIAEELSEPLQVELLFQSGAILSDEEMALREQVSEGGSEAQLQAALTKVDERCEWFSSEAADLKDLFVNDDRPEQFFLINDAPRTERVALALARLHFGIRGGASKSSDSIMGKLSSLFGR